MLIFLGFGVYMMHMIFNAIKQENVSQNATSQIIISICIFSQLSKEYKVLVISFGTNLCITATYFGGWWVDLFHWILLVNYCWWSYALSSQQPKGGVGSIVVPKQQEQGCYSSWWCIIRNILLMYRSILFIFFIHYVLQYHN